MLKGHARVLSRQEVEALLDAPTQRYYSQHRQYLVMRVMAEVGLRPSEVTGLIPERISFDSGRMSVIGKGDKKRVLYLKKTLVNELLDWMGRREESEWLFPTTKGTKVDPGHLRSGVKRHARNVGLDNTKRISPYSFRHTFATRLYQKTKDIQIVRDALGHESVATTMDYVHVDSPSENELKNALT